MFIFLSNLKMEVVKSISSLLSGVLLSLYTKTTLTPFWPNSGYTLKESCAMSASLRVVSYNRTLASCPVHSRTTTASVYMISVLANSFPIHALPPLLKLTKYLFNSSAFSSSQRCGRNSSGSGNIAEFICINHDDILIGVPAEMVYPPTYRSSSGAMRVNRAMTPWLRRNPSLMTALNYGRRLSSMMSGGTPAFGIAYLRSSPKVVRTPALASR